MKKIQIELTEQEANSTLYSLEANKVIIDECIDKSEAGTEIKEMWIADANVVTDVMNKINEAKRK
jgi:hypothetical protein